MSPSHIMFAFQHMPISTISCLNANIFVLFSYVQKSAVRNATQYTCSQLLLKCFCIGARQSHLHSLSFIDKATCFLFPVTYMATATMPSSFENVDQSVLAFINKMMVLLLSSHRHGCSCHAFHVRTCRSHPCCLLSTKLHAFSFSHRHGHSCNNFTI